MTPSDARPLRALSPPQQVLAARRRSWTVPPHTAPPRWSAPSCRPCHVLSLPRSLGLVLEPLSLPACRGMWAQSPCRRPWRRLDYLLRAVGALRVRLAAVAEAVLELGLVVAVRVAALGCVFRRRAASAVVVLVEFFSGFFSRPLLAVAVLGARVALGRPLHALLRALVHAPAVHARDQKVLDGGGQAVLRVKGEGGDSAFLEQQSGYLSFADLQRRRRASCR